MTTHTVERQVPAHWIGVWSGWQEICQTIGDALVEITPADLATHALVIGSTGSGKTNAIHHLIAGDLIRQHSIVVLDALGDFAHATLEIAARAGVDPGKVLFYNLREKAQPLGFNPLAGNGEPYYRALGLIDAVANQSETWGPQLAEYLRNGTLLLAETQSNLTQLAGLFYNAQVRKSLIERARSLPLRDFWTRYDRLGGDKQAALASPVLNKVSALLSTEGLRRMYGHPSPPDLSKQLSTPGSVTLISLAVDEVHSAGWMTGSIMLSAICREIFSQANVAESDRNAVRIYVDEFEAFSMRDFELILAQGRRFRLSAVLAHQTLAQLSPKMRSVILGNVGVKIVFRTGYQDAEVLNKDLVGVKGAFDLANLPVGEAILWRRGDNPWPIEINAPLIYDVGRLSPVAREFLGQISALVPAYYEVVDEPRTSEIEDEAEETKSPPPSNRPKGGGASGAVLEDWLR